MNGPLTGLNAGGGLRPAPTPEARQAAALAAFQAAQSPALPRPSLRRPGEGASLSAGASTEANLGRLGAQALPPPPDGSALRDAAIQLLQSLPGPERLRRPGPWSEALNQALAIDDPQVREAAQAWAQGLVQATAQEVVKARSALRLSPQALNEATEASLKALGEQVPGLVGTLAQSGVAPQALIAQAVGEATGAPSPASAAMAADQEGTALKGEALAARLGAYQQQAGGIDPAAAARLQASAQAFLRQQAPQAQAPQAPAAPRPQAPPPLPPEEKGWFDRLMDKASSLGDAVVDGLEDALAAPSEAVARQVEDVPVLGPLAKGFAWMQRQSAQVVGGVLRGAGGLVEGVATMIAHPIDTAKGLATLASHIPMIPANPIRLAQAGWDIVVEGKPAVETLRQNLDPRLVLADDLNFAKGVVQAFAEPYTQAVEQGRYGEAIGRGLFEVVTTVFTGGSAAGAKVGVEGARAANLASDVARAANLAGDAARAANVAGDAARVANVASDAARAANLAGDAARAANVAGDASRAANLAGDAARAANAAGDAARAAEVAGTGARAANAAGDAARAARVADEGALLARAAGESSALARAFPPSIRKAVDESRALLRRALGEANPADAQRALRRVDDELLGNFRFSSLDEAGKAKELARIQADAASLGRSVEGLPRGVQGRIAELADVQKAEEVLELLAQRNPEALKQLYRQSYEAFGVDADKAFQFIHDYTHSSTKVNPDTFKDIGAAARSVLGDAPVGPGGVTELSERAQILKQMLDTRVERQAYIHEVLGLEPPAGYRVFRGTSNPDSVLRTAEAWFKGQDQVAVTNRGITSTSLDPTVAVDFSRGGPRSVTVDADVVRHLEELKTNPNAVAPVRQAAEKPTFVNFDFDVDNRSVVFDKYTDGGFSVDGTTAQRAQREVLIGGPQDSFLADPRRAQITYQGRTFHFEDRQALFEALQGDPAWQKLLGQGP